MGSTYKFYENPFRDYLVMSLVHGIDVSEKRFKNEIDNTFAYILENVLNDPKDVLYLDFKIQKKKNYYKIIGKNAISSIWLSGILPRDVDTVMEDNKFIIGDKEYSYDKKTNELKYKLVKN